MEKQRTTTSDLGVWGKKEQVALATAQPSNRVILTKSKTSLDSMRTECAAKYAVHDRSQAASVGTPLSGSVWLACRGGICLQARCRFDNDLLAGCEKIAFGWQPRPWRRLSYAAMNNFGNAFGGPPHWGPIQRWETKWQTQKRKPRRRTCRHTDTWLAYLLRVRLVHCLCWQEEHRQPHKNSEQCIDHQFVIGHQRNCAALADRARRQDDGRSYRTTQSNWKCRKLLRSEWTWIWSDSH